LPDAGSPLIATLAIALVAAILGGLLAVRLRLPPIVGYLVAGIAVGPFTPGLVADRHLATDLAEIGVILLMFGVGIHFSFRDLFAVRAIAVPGAVVQIAAATGLTVAMSAAFGIEPRSGLVLGLAISVASTVVLLRALLERSLIDTLHGRVAVGWLIVEDLFTVLVLVALPLYARLTTDAASDPLALLGTIALTLAKVGALAVLMIVGGTRFVPWILGHVARTGSRELFTLGVLALALGIAFAASALFDVSVALGAFLAGAALSESDLSHHAASEALPLRDAFAVLFFVSVGMLLDPGVLLSAPLAVALLVLLVTVGKGAAAFGIVVLFGYPVRTALTVAVGLAQIGEFSFIVSALALSLGLLTDQVHSLVLAAAIITITLNPFLFRVIDPLERRLAPSGMLRRLGGRRAGELARPSPAVAEVQKHAILCGYGQVGALVVTALSKRGFTSVVIDLDRRVVERLRAVGVEALYGDAGNTDLLEHAGLDRARVLIVTVPDPSATRRVVEYARRRRSDLEIIARTDSEAEWRRLRGGPLDSAVLAERELAVAMASHALRRFGVSSTEILAITRGLRDS
jgi:CPA2 family monovalent cation:H+ antiporter-2